MLSGAHRAICCMRKNVYKYINIHMPFLKASIKWNSTILKYLETLSKFQFQIHRFAVKAPSRCEIAYHSRRYGIFSIARASSARVGLVPGAWSSYATFESDPFGLVALNVPIVFTGKLVYHVYLHENTKSQHLHTFAVNLFLRFFGPFNSMKNSPAGHAPVDSPGFEPNQLPMTHVLQAMHDLKSCKMTTRWGETADGFRNLAKTSWGW